MSVKDKILDQIKTAMKARDQLRLDTLRMVKAKIQEKEVELRGKKGRDHVLEEEDIQQVLTTSAKQRRDSIESFRAGGREELAAKEEKELAIIQEFLPQQLSDEELQRLVKEAVEETGAKSPKDMGMVMKAVMPKVKGQADGKRINAVVRVLLS
ncbi:MAG: GatB/YqeY domain-containing protein [Acidobacteria bacterium]|uniref:GatB/YqeY domain-containing protein n=1 Tax=Candidatus Polarisedimenticola svalbardensis TaxID=2886004 RepID=A0A8J6Y0B5_9BACT|nr:GatB/YqeY domain-containing protein [Candidatus Polarisedimenticola svalbardensis]